MPKSKSSISKSSSYRQIGEFWDTHDLSEFWDKTKPVSFDVAMESETTYYAVHMKLSEEVEAIARKRGVAADTLINLWVQEKAPGTESVIEWSRSNSSTSFLDEVTEFLTLQLLYS